MAPSTPEKPVPRAWAQSTWSLSPLTWHRPRAVSAGASVHPPPLNKTWWTGSEKVAKTSSGVSCPHCPPPLSYAERQPWQSGREVSRLFAEAEPSCRGFQTDVLGHR